MSQEATRAGQPDRRKLANAVRALSMDAVQAANSGHPGAPMGMADIAEVGSRPLRIVERPRLDVAL